MKRIFLPLFVVLFASIALVGCSESNAPKEGVKYTVVPTPMPEMKGITEIFSLSCGNCRNMESLLPDIKKMTNSDINQVHVTFNESAQKAAFIFDTAMVQTDNKPSHALVEQLFAYTQDSPKDLTPAQQKAAIEKIFHENKLKSPYELSEDQQVAVFEMMLEAEKIVKNSGLDSVPAFLVNGKYLVKTSAHESLEDLVNTIDYLKEKK